MPRIDWVDLSKWQGVIPAAVFSQWHAAGVQGVILKVGGGNDGRYKDTCFDANLSNARAGGLQQQGYWFNGLTDPAGDADFAHGITPPGFLIWADVENETPMPHWTPQQANAFQTRLEQLGHPTGAYMSQSVTFGDWSLINHRPLWVAAYGPASTPRVGSWAAPVLWQHSSSGQLPGYGGRLDVNETQSGFASIGNGALITQGTDDDEMISKETQDWISGELKRQIAQATTVNLYRNSATGSIAIADVSKGFWREFSSMPDMNTLKSLGVFDPDENLQNIDPSLYAGIKGECVATAKRFLAAAQSK